MRNLTQTLKWILVEAAGAFQGAEMSKHPGMDLNISWWSVKSCFSSDEISLQTWNEIILLLFQFSRSVMSDSLRPRGLQHARPPCPSPTPGVYLNSRPLGRWCHPTISFSVIPFSSRLQSCPVSGSFQMSQMSQLFASGGQSIGLSALASVLSVNTQDWSPLE